MVKTKGEETPKESIEEPKEPETPPDTLTQEEHEAKLKEALKEQYDELNVTLSKQGADLKRLREQAIQPSTTPRIGSKALEVLKADMEARQEFGEPNPRVALLEAEIVKERQREAQAVQEQTRVVQETIDGYRKRVEGLGLSENDEEYWEVHDLVTEGKYQRADIKLKKLEGAKPPESKEQGEAEEDSFEKRLEEEKRKWMEEKGLLESETTTPSGSGGLSGLNAETLREKMKDTEWFKEHEEEIDKLYAGGKL